MGSYQYDENGNMICIIEEGAVYKQEYNTKLPKSTNLVLVACLLSVTLLWILGCNTIATPDPNRFPVKTMQIEMELEQRKEFFNQLQGFADKHFFKLETTFNDRDKKSFIIIMTGDGFRISALSHLYSPREINFFFYNEASSPTSPQTFDELYNDLKNFLKEVPNILIKEKLQGLRITMDENQRDGLFNDFFSQLRDFATQYSLEFTVSSFDSDMKLFLVEMDGEGFQITSEATMSGAGKMDVDFYIHYMDNGEPTPTSNETVDELFNGLKSYFGEISNVTITELP